MTEFDSGYKECKESKLDPLYARIEDAIIDLRKIHIYVKDLLDALHKALKEADK